MKGLRLHIWLILCLLFPLTAEGQTVSAMDTVTMRNDYITASILVVDPASEVYSMFGHCALRLECPTHNMDYCFTFEMSTDSKGIINFFTGQSMGGFKPAPTQDYLDYYQKEQRGITQYVLNLTPAEKLKLWKVVDEEVAKGHYWHYDYRRVQCVSMLIYLVGKALEQPIVYHNLPLQVQGTLRHQILTEGKAFPWSEFCFQTIKGSEVDVLEPIEEKITPRTLPLTWQQATIGNEGRLLITDKGESLISSQTVESVSFTPTHACTLLFILVIIISWGQWRYGWRILPLITDIALIVVYTVMALIVTTLVLYSRNTGVSWNWYLPAFNPVPLILWFLLPRWHRWIAGCMAVIFLISIILTPFIPQFDLPHALLMSCIMVRLFNKAINN